MRLKLSRMFTRVAVTSLILCFSTEGAFASTDPKLDLAPINPAFLRWMERKSKNVDTKKAVRTLLRDGAAESKNSGDGKEYGLIPEPFDTSYLKDLRKKTTSGTVKARSAIPARYDLREKGLLTSIKNQGTYGTCWAHAACGVLESSLLKAREGIYDFSENNMANLHGFDWDFNKGGNAGVASAYLLRWSGPVLESQDPYPNVGGSTEIAPARHVQNIRWIPGRLDYTDNDHIKQAVINYGAIYVNYHHDGSYLASDGKSYCFDFSGTNDTNHAVVIVGWDDNYPACKFKNVPVGNGAFIMRNSWGTGHGENGYFYVSYYDKIFGWHTMHAFLPPEEVDNYDSIYQYDPLGNTLAWGWGGETSWGANIFHAKSLERIQAVGFYALTPNTSYEIYVYRGCQSDNPRSGTLDATLNGVTDSAGYFTMPLSSNAVLQKGDRFSVVIKLTTPGYDNPLAIEHSITYTKEDGEEDPYSTKAESAPGQSFMSPDGNYWRDITDFYETMNFCCKVYTTSVSSSEGINNDNFANAALLSGESGKISASNAGATFESEEPEHKYSSATTSVWWKWTPTKSGSVTFSTEGSSFDTILAVYTGSTLSSLEQYALDDDKGSNQTSICTFEVVAGTTYYIAVAGYDAKTGAIKLSWEQIVKVLPDLIFSYHYLDEWTTEVFLSNLVTGKEPVTTFDYGEKIYLFCGFGNDGEHILEDDFNIRHELIDGNGCVISTWNYTETDTIPIGKMRKWEGAEWGAFDNLSPGTYTYRCTLDERNDIEEINEFDNVREYEFTVLPPPDVISVVPVSISCNGNGIGINDDYHINVSANCSWKAEVSDEWIKIYGHDYGNGDGRIWIGVEPNLTKDSRFGTITFSNEGGSVKCSVSIAQDGASVQFVIEDGVLIDCITEGETEAVVPKTVVSIGDWAFSDCKTLTTVVLPACVTNIGAYAFYNCSKLKNINLPNGVMAIGSSAFYGCSSLEEIVIPEGVKEINYGTFDGCLKLKSVKIPDSVKYIGGHAFDEWCWQLYDESTIKGVRLVDGWCVGYNDELSGAIDLTMTRGVSAGAFQDCINLEEVKLPVIESIGSYMFDGCSSLIKVYIPDGVRRLEACSFGDCSSLSSISIPSTVRLLEPNVFTGCSSSLFDKNTIPGTEMVDGWVIKGEKTLSGVLDISNVRGIAGGAFDGCTKLTDVVFPNNIESIGNATFKNCTGLTEIVIPSKVVDIGVNVFYGCENLKKVFLPLACKDYINENDVFRGTSGDLQIIYYCNVTIILDANGGELPGELSISTITGVAIGTLPTPIRGGYTFLGWFSAADGGEQVTADTVVTGDMTLYAHWEEVLKEPSFEIDENGVLSSVELNGAAEIIIPSNVKVIADEALSGCCDLTSVTIPEGVVSIGYDAFNCCCALTSINIPSTVTNIGDNAFGNCTNLRIVTGGEGLKRVGYDAFYNTLFLYKADSWADVESNEDYMNDYGLDLVRLGNFIVGRRGSLEEAWNDEYFDENENWTWEYNLVIPEGVTGIADSLFEDLPITSVTIPGSIKRIPENAFNSCCYLKNLTINEGVEEIGDYAFQRAGSYLEEDGITTLTIPSSVTKIGEYGFASLGCLKYVIGLDDADDVHSDAFYGTPYADGWEAPVLIIEDGVVYGLDRETRFDDGCITNNVLYIPEGVTNIADCAFKEMYEFSKAVLPSSLRSIGHEAFYDCEELREVEGGVNLERVGYNVFNETLFLYKADSWEDVEANEDYMNDYGLDLVRLGNFIVGRRGSLAEAGNDEYYDEEGNWIWKYELVIPDGVTGLADELFNDLPITSVTIPNSIVSIPDYTFTYTELESVVIPENIVSIGEEAFASCANLKYAKVPLALKSQVEEGNVFAYCSPDLQIEYYDNASLVAPVITPCDGTEFYEDSCIVTITCETEGALIYYTTDGTTPRPRPTNLYTGAFEIADTTTVKAIAVKGDECTDLVSATIVKKDLVLAEPVITPTDGTEFYEDFCTVTISCATEGASIYYVVCDTNNVTNPRPSDRNLYTGPFTVSATKMVRAFSMFGSKTSDIVSSTLIKRELTLPVAVDAPELTFTTGGDAKWTPEFNGSAKVGGSLAQSGALSWSETDDDPSETWMETTVAGAGTFSFWWKVDCEDDPWGATWDRFEVYTNGVEAARIDGKTEWEKIEFTFADSRTHTVRWRFYKDYWDDEKLTDLAWVDGVVWTPASTDITVDVGGGKNVVVPVSWIDKYDSIVTAAGGDKVAALMLTAANGRKVWECFMLGVDPTRADDDFRITRFWMENGKPMFEFTHSVDGAGNSFAPRIKTKGKAKLSDSWSDVPTGGDSSFRFFTVEVMLP